jgi:hypothetical protein
MLKTGIIFVQYTFWQFLTFRFSYLVRNPGWEFAIAVLPKLRLFRLLNYGTDQHT